MSPGSILFLALMEPITDGKCDFQPFLLDYYDIVNPGAAISFVAIIAHINLVFRTLEPKYKAKILDSPRI